MASLYDPLPGTTVNPDGSVTIAPGFDPSLPNGGTLSPNGNPLLSPATVTPNAPAVSDPAASPGGLTGWLGGIMRALGLPATTSGQPGDSTSGIPSSPDVPFSLPGTTTFPAQPPDTSSPNITGPVAGATTPTGGQAGVFAWLGEATTRAALLILGLVLVGAGFYLAGQRGALGIGDFEPGEARRKLAAKL